MVCEACREWTHKYLRHTTRRKDGKIHVYGQWIRPARHGREMGQRTMEQLGELDAEGRARTQALARSIAGDHADVPQRHPFAGEPAEAVPVKLGKVHVERSHSFRAVRLK